MARFGGSIGGTLGPALALRRAAAWAPVLVLGLVLAYFLDPNARLDFSVFDTRDSESYLALSRSLVTGIGYSRNLDPRFYIAHTTWPPGLPLLLMPWVALAGLPMNFLIVKFGMIAYGAIGLIVAYLYARRLSPSPLVQVATPLLLGCDPYYWQLSRLVLTEVPSVLWALLALLLVDIGWGKGTIRSAPAFAFGLVAGFGMLIRGSLYGALFLPLVYLLVLRPERLDLKRLSSYLPYAAGFVLPFLVWKLRCSMIASAALGQDGIDQLAMILRARPVDPASPLRSLGEIGSDMATTLASAIEVLPRSLIPGLWASAAWAPMGAAAAAAVAALLSIAILAVSFAARRNLPLILMYGSMALLNLFYAAGSMLRLWVPVAALVAVSLPSGFEALLPLARRGAGSFVAALGAAFAVSLVFYIDDHDARPYRNSAYAALAGLFEAVRDGPPLHGLVLTPDPQAFTLATGYDAPMALLASGVDPDYGYVVAPAAEASTRLAGRTIEKNAVWRLVALDQPQKLAEIREQVDCRNSPLPAFAVLMKCPMW